MSLERRNSASRLKMEKVERPDEKEGGSHSEEEKKGSLLSKLGVTRSKRLSTNSSPKVEKPTAPEAPHTPDFHYKGHRPTHEEMVAHLESFTRTRTPTIESPHSTCVPQQSHPCRRSSLYVVLRLRSPARTPH